MDTRDMTTRQTGLYANHKSKPWTIPTISRQQQCSWEDHNGSVGSSGKTDDPKANIKSLRIDSPRTSPTKNNLITATLSPEISRKKHVSFANYVAPGNQDTGPDTVAPQILIYDAETYVEDSDHARQAHRCMPGTSSVFQQALNSLKNKPLDSDSASASSSTHSSPLPGDLHVRRSSLIAAMAELELSDVKDRYNKESQQANDKEHMRGDTLDESSRSQSGKKQLSNKIPPNTESNVHLSISPKQRVRKISAPCKLQNASKPAWKIHNDTSPKSSPKQSPSSKRRSVSTVCPPRASDLDISRYSERRRRAGTAEQPKLSTDMPSLVKQSSSPPKASQRTKKMTLKDIHTVSKYIQQASAGAGYLSTSDDVFGFNNGQILSPRQVLIRRGMALTNTGWVHDGLSDVVEVTTFEDIKRCRYIRGKKESRYHEV